MDPKRLGRSVEPEIVPISNTVTITVERRCTNKQSGRFTLDVPTAFHLKNIKWQRTSKRHWFLGRRTGKGQQVWTRWLEEETRCPMAWRRASGPQRTPDTDMAQNLFPKAYHPPVQGRGQLEPGAPCRRIHLATYHRADACARHAIGANQHGLGRPFGAQPMPVPPSHLDFLAPIPRPPLESYCADIWAGQTRGNSTGSAV